MLTKEQIEQNKKTFIDIVGMVGRESNKDGLIEYLSNTDFFTSPASAQYYGAYEGGLCEYCLNVYANFLKLLNTSQSLSNIVISEGDESTLVIAPLLHAIGRANCYEKYVMNKKVYRDIGLKKDELGHFDWVSSWGYRYKEKEDRFVLGNTAENSAYILNYYIPLYKSEYSAILNSQLDYSNDNKNDTGVYDSYNTYRLSSILHMAIEYTIFLTMRKDANEQVG